jgi:hypothetical protein
MRSKTMTIHEFMEMEREKENKKSNKSNKDTYVLIALLAFLSILTYYSIDLSDNTVTAFLWSELQC